MLGWVCRRALLHSGAMIFDLPRTSVTETRGARAVVAAVVCLTLVVSGPAQASAGSRDSRADLQAEIAGDARRIGQVDTDEVLPSLDWPPAPEYLETDQISADEHTLSVEADDAEIILDLEALGDSRVLAEIPQLASDYDIPVIQHPLVRAYVSGFTQGKAWFTRWLARLHRYRPVLEAILVAHGLPTDTVYLALIESGIEPRAHSWADAAGIWQFIPSTGRIYGLKIDFWLDERRDLVKATGAAARYLSDLYSMFGDWHLAWAAYNAGQSKILSAAKKAGDGDFWQLRAGHRLIARETAHYVPKLLGAAIVDKNAVQLGFQIPEDEPVDVDELAEPPSDLPTDGADGTVGAVGADTAAPVAAGSLRSDEFGGDAPAAEKKKYTVGEAWQRGPFRFDMVEVERMIDLAQFAKWVGVDAALMMQMNPHLRRGCTPPNNPATVYLPPNTKAKVLAALASLTDADAMQVVTYTVQPGDSIEGIASKFKSRAEAIQSVNEAVVPAKGSVAAGMVLKVPVLPNATPDAAESRKGRYGKWAPRSIANYVPNPALAGKTHTLKSGENPWIVASKYGLPVEVLLSLNGLSPRDVRRIRPGMVFKLGPSKAASIRKKK